jgi:hypothetical protein
MKTMRIAVITLVLGLATSTAAFANYFRQYYTPGWAYSVSNSYYYTTYYYQVTVAQPVYYYHYCVYYPAYPTYIYYYNPYSQVYWGRYVIGSKGNDGYSILAKEDRKKDLKDIPESAFPAPGPMPTIPGAKDGVQMLPPPENVPGESK